MAVEKNNHCYYCYASNILLYLTFLQLKNVANPKETNKLPSQVICKNCLDK